MKRGFSSIERCLTVTDALYIVTYIKSGCPLHFDPFKFTSTIEEGDVVGYNDDWHAFTPSIATLELCQLP
jgi:hypothetical protein